MSNWSFEKDKARDRAEFIAALNWQIRHGFLKQEDFDQKLKDWEVGKIIDY
jgi:hypothetical protein